MLIDTHAHLEEVVDLSEALARASAQGVAAIIAVGSDEASNRRALAIARKNQSLVHPALGLHPWQLREVADWEGELRFIEAHIDQAVAIGEIGLDYDRRVTRGAGKALQQQVLSQLLKLAGKYSKPALLHARYAFPDCLELVKRAQQTKVVFHWFTGPLKVLEEITSLGYFVSATPAAEYHPQHQQAIRACPLSHLLLETDTPVEYGRNARYQSQPADLVRTLRAVARLKKVEEPEVARITTENALKLFGLGS